MFVRLLLLPPALLLGLGSLAAEDLQPTNFEKVRLTEEYYAEGASVGDFNQDGKTDIVCGNKKGTFLFLAK